MSEEFSYPDRHPPGITSTFALATMAAVAVAGIAALVLAKPAPDALAIADVTPVTVSATGEVDQSWPSAAAGDNVKAGGKR